MKHLRKPVSLLLALIMVLSVFTIIPFATASAAEGDKVVFFTQNAQNPDWWGSNVYAYFYDSTDNNHVYSDAWPGTQLTQLTTNEYAQPVYSMIIPAAADNLIINNGTGWQLDNITGFADGYLYWINNGSGNAVGQTNTTTAEVPATCTVAGHEAGYAINGQNSTVNYFKLENGALVDGTIAATGHTWDTASPVWDTDPVNDNGTWKLGFVFNCTQGDGSTEKQWATCAAPEGTPASCTAAAQYSGTFTGTFDSESYSKELTWTVGDPAGHDYEEVWTWADDYTSAELTITCSVCGDTKSGSTTDVERIVVTEATYTTDGDGVYSAHVTIGGVEYVGSKAYTIPATGYPYYLALASNSYGFAKKYQFTDLNNGEYSIKGVYLTAGEQFKVRNTEQIPNTMIIGGLTAQTTTILSSLTASMTFTSDPTAAAVKTGGTTYSSSLRLQLPLPAIRSVCAMISRSTSMPTSPSTTTRQPIPAVRLLLMQASLRSHPLPRTITATFSSPA